VPAIEASGLVKVHDRGAAGRRILDGAELAVARGELVAIRGRSGTGKSTLLHLLGALDRPDEGRITLAGQRIDGRRERELTALRRRLVGFVFQFFHLIGELTGEENVLLASRLPGAVPGAPDNARRLIEGLGLTEAAGRLPHQLSGGEQQRIAIARALVNDPPIVLADEPTGNLDAESGHAVMVLLRAIADEGRAVVIVTHEPEATASADRVLELVDGRLR
jgi:ABC-type lipoprotein export system ATPase subunit